MAYIKIKDLNYTWKELGDLTWKQLNKMSKKNVDEYVGRNKVK